MITAAAPSPDGQQCNNVKGSAISRALAFPSCTLSSTVTADAERDVVLWFEVIGYTAFRLSFDRPAALRPPVEAVQQLDYTLIMGTTVFYGSFLVFMVIVVDLIYGLIDPRVRLA